LDLGQVHNEVLDTEWDVVLDGEWDAVSEEVPGEAVVVEVTVRNGLNPA